MIVSPARLVELSKLFLDIALDLEFDEVIRTAASDTVYALGELEELRGTGDQSCKLLQHHSSKQP